MAKDLSQTSTQRAEDIHLKFSESLKNYEKSLTTHQYIKSFIPKTRKNVAKRTWHRIRRNLETKIDMLENGSTTINPLVTNSSLIEQRKRSDSHEF